MFRDHYPFGEVAPALRAAVVVMTTLNDHTHPNPRGGCTGDDTNRHSRAGRRDEHTSQLIRDKHRSGANRRAQRGCHFLRDAEVVVAQHQSSRGRAGNAGDPQHMLSAISISILTP